jgi:phosphonoacetaldehyde hydrolase
MTGNEIGCTEAEIAAMDPVALGRRRAAGYAHLRAAGAHAVIDGIAELPAVIAAFEARSHRPRAA